MAWYCIYCGRANENMKLICSGCGASKPRGESPTVVPVAAMTSLTSASVSASDEISWSLSESESVSPSAEPEDELEAETAGWFSSAISKLRGNR